jgi:hypothetical protein
LNANIPSGPVKTITIQVSPWISGW